MKARALAILLTLTAAALFGVSHLRAQIGALKIMTYPTIPKRDIMDRLSLSIGWHTRVKTDGLRDGIFSVQVLPAPSGPQLAIQTLSGRIILMDGETGDALWTVQPTLPYWTMKELGYNSHSIIAVRREQLFILNRANGLHRLSTDNPVLKDRDLGMPLPNAPTAAPAADDDLLFLSMNSRLMAYLLPRYRDGKAMTESERNSPLYELRRNKIEHPELLWTFTLEGENLPNAPVVGSDQVGVASSSGSFFSFDKYVRRLRYEFKTRGDISAALGQHHNSVYLPSHDLGLYALDFARDRVQWRYLSGGPLTKQPQVTDQDVFAMAQGVGLTRLDRQTGENYWVNPQADQFLAGNHRFVYAMDRKGHFLVLDYGRGTTLGYYDFRDWQVPVSNPWSDRVYLVNHDGQVLCLHYRDNRFPLKTKAMPIYGPMLFEEPRKVAPKVEEAAGN